MAYTDDTTVPTGAEADAILERLRDRFDYADTFWRPIREEARKDMMCLAGEIWEAMDPEGLSQREDAHRPHLSLDELDQYVNQVINELRANPRALKFAPASMSPAPDAKQSEATAQFYGDKMREIEYRSRAPQGAYILAAENAIQRSYGYCRLTTKRESPRSRNLDLWIEGFVNPDLVLPDPDAQDPASLDMRYCLVAEQWLITDFKAKWPKAQAIDFASMSRMYPKWFPKDKHLIVAEYWEVETVHDELVRVLLADQSAYADVLRSEMEPGMVEQADPPPLDVEIPKVCQYLTNGVEILSKTPWPGSRIPIVSCYGKQLYFDSGAGPVRKILSMVRKARSPLMGYCFYRTCEAEQVGQMTKNPYWAYEGQLSQEQLNEVAKSIHEPVAMLLAKPTTESTGQQVLPLPQRNVSQPAIQALSVAAEEMRRAIQSAMGLSPLPTQAQKQNEKSGVALRAIEESGQRGSYHFVDHYETMIQAIGIHAEDVLDKIIDTPRDVAIRNGKDETEIVHVNDPNDPESVQTKGTHLVTVSTGPSYQSEREMASEFVDTIVGGPFMQMIAQLAGPDVAKQFIAIAIKMKNLGVFGDELAEMIAPPEDEQALPPKVKESLQQAQQLIEMLMQEVQKLQQKLEVDEVKEQAETERVQMREEARVILEQMKKAGEYALQKMKGDQAVVLQLVKGQQDLALQDDAQAHELGLSAADAMTKMPPMPPNTGMGPG